MKENLLSEEYTQGVGIELWLWKIDTVRSDTGNG